MTPKEVAQLFTDSSTQLNSVAKLSSVQSRLMRTFKKKVLLHTHNFCYLSMSQLPLYA